MGSEIARYEGAPPPERVEVLPAPRQEYSIEELYRIAQAATKSGIYKASAPNPEAAFMLALRCQAEGIHPGLAFAQFHLIEGQPSLKAEAMLARFQRAGGVIRWIRTDGEVCHAEFSHPAYMPEPVAIKLTMQQAEQRGLTVGRDGKKKNWKSFPEAMLRARVVAAGVRACLPGVISGVYTPEEMEDLAQQASASPRPLAPVSRGFPSAGLSAPPGAAPSFKAFCKQVVERGELDNIEICSVIVHRAAQIGEGEHPPEDATPKEVALAAWHVFQADPGRAIAWVEEAEALKSGQSVGAPDDLPEVDDQADDAEVIDPEEAELDRLAARDAGRPPSKSDRLAGELG